MKRIVLTGGGTAGHVTPNIALLPGLKERGYDISYIGSYEGIEKKKKKKESIPYYGISSGKLRRYIDLKNLSDPFRVVKGLNEAGRLLRQLKPDVIFSKGGFVAVPVILAAGRKHIPIIAHESDMTPGLANKICIPYATKICCNFPETKQNLPEGKAVVTGSPLRKELMEGDAAAGRAFCGFDDSKPVLMITGGSLGSVNVNNHMRAILPALLEDFQVVHLCGKGNLEPSLDNTPSYRQYEYIGKELPDLFAMADLIVSRAGANSICEISALAKPNLLIPLSANASRGDQILNARSYEKQGFSKVLEEEELTDDILLATIRDLFQNRQTFIDTMRAANHTDAVTMILDLLDEACGNNATP